MLLFSRWQMLVMFRGIVAAWRRLRHAGIRSVSLLEVLRCTTSVRCGASLSIAGVSSELVVITRQICCVVLRTVLCILSCNLVVPCSRTPRYGQKICCPVPLLWNSTPSTVCDPLLTLTQFCAFLTTVLLVELKKHYRSTTMVVQVVSTDVHIQTCSLIHLIWCCYVQSICGLLNCIIKVTARW